MLVCLLVRGTEVKNDLCCCLDDVTHLPGIYIIICTKHFGFTRLFSKVGLWKMNNRCLGVASLLLISRGYLVLMSLWNREVYCLDALKDALLSLNVALNLGTRKMSTILSWVRLASQEVTQRWKVDQCLATSFLDSSKHSCIIV